MSNPTQPQQPRRELPQIRQLFHTLSDLPPFKEGAEDQPFWSLVESDDFKLAVNLLMVNKAVSLANVDLETYPAPAKDSVLGYFKALGELLCLPSSLKEAIKNKAGEESPENNPLTD